MFLIVLPVNFSEIQQFTRRGGFLELGIQVESDYLEVLYLHQKSYLEVLYLHQKSYLEVLFSIPGVPIENKTVKGGGLL